jgi:outer membrane protein, multidrug efflux system
VSSYKSLILLVLSLTAAVLLARPASAGPFDLDDDDDKKSADKKEEGFGTYTPPVVTVKPRTYTLEECLALTDRNHPNLWAARARLASTHAQLEEAKWLPFWQWSAGSNFGVLPPISGTIAYTSAPVSALGLSFGQGIQPVFSLDINGVFPLYTFGKIDAGKRAAQAQVRVFEWDLEKWRNFARMDVRRAYFGLQFSRDARYIVDDTLGRLDKAIKGLATKIDKGDNTVDETDKLRLELYRDEIVARSGDAQKGETYAVAALRFLTGLQSGFDIPDEPLKRPDAPLVAVIQYLSAARVFRPEVGQARAGVVARQALVDLQRARYFPDFGLGFFGSYAVAPSVTTQSTALAPNPFNHFYGGAGIGFRWSLDLLPNAARVHRAESDLEEARALLRLALGGIAVEVENAHGTALEAKNREETWERAEHRSKKWISTVSDAIDLGAKDERALIEPLRAYVNSRVQHMYALFDYNVAMSELARVSGWDTAAPTGK